MKLHLIQRASRALTGKKSDYQPKTPRLNRTCHGMTMLEALVTIFLLFMLAIVLLPALVPNHRHRAYINCSNNLKQVGLAFRIWEGDHNDKYPMAVSVTNGGAMEAVASGNAVAVFQIMSNELSTPKILVCPEDEQRTSATNFNFSATSKHVSYFINIDASEVNPQDMMCGDDNLRSVEFQ